MEVHLNRWVMQDGTDNIGKVKLIEEGKKKL